jgi:uncharacterized protein YjbI with pentapeptide repeats
MDDSLKNKAVKGGLNNPQDANSITPQRILFEAGKASLGSRAGYRGYETKQPVYFTSREFLDQKKLNGIINAVNQGEFQNVQHLIYIIAFIFPQVLENTGLEPTDYAENSGLAILELCETNLFNLIPWKKVCEGFIISEVIKEDCNLSNSDFSRSIFINSFLPEFKAENVNMSHINISGTDLSKAYLNKCVLHEAVLEDVEMQGSDITETTLYSAILLNVNLVSSSLKNDTLSRVKLTNVALDNSSLILSSLDHSIIKESSLINAYLQGCTMYKISFINCEIDNAIFENSSPQDGLIDKCSMQSASFIDCYLKGITISNSNLLECTFGAETRVSKANFRNTNLSQSKWRGVNYGSKSQSRVINDADFYEARLNDGSFIYKEIITEGPLFHKCEMVGSDFQEEKMLAVRFNQTNLQDSNFSNAELEEVKLGNVNLTNAKFSNVEIKKSSFFDSNLKNANLSQALIENSYFIGVDLTGANLKGAVFRNVKFERAIMPDGTMYKEGCLERFTGVVGES